MQKKGITLVTLTLIALLVAPRNVVAAESSSSYYYYYYEETEVTYTEGKHTVTIKKNSDGKEEVYVDGRLQPSENATTNSNSSSSSSSNSKKAKKSTKKTGWQTANGKKCYYTKKGKKVKSQMKKIGKYTYYFNKNGVMQKNKMVTIDNKKYGFNKKGHLIKDKWYKFNENEQYIYFDKNGVAKYKYLQ